LSGGGGGEEDYLNFKKFLAYQWIFEVSDEVIEHITGKLRVPITREHALGINKSCDWDVRNKK
jgi:hypothetical protein